MAGIYLDRQSRIRTALFVYLRIALDKLPAWCNFWQIRQDALLLKTPEGLKTALTSLHTLDTQTKCDISTIISRFNRLKERTKDLKKKQGWSSEDQSNTNPGKAELWKILSELMSGFYLRAEIEDIVEDLTVFYEPRFQAVIDLYEEVLVESCFSDERSAFKHQMAIMKEIRQWFKDELEKRPMFEEDISACRDAEIRIAEVLEFMRKMDSLFKFQGEVLGKMLSRLQAS